MKAKLGGSRKVNIQTYKGIINFCGHSGHWDVGDDLVIETISYSKIFFRASSVFFPLGPSPGR